jgi:hypothetical protein
MCALFIWVDWNGWQILHTYHTTLRTLAQFISKNKILIILFSQKTIVEGNLKIFYNIQKYSISWMKSKNSTNYSANICWSYPLHYDIPIGQSQWRQNVKEKGLSEPAPMTTLVPFWMEGNSSTDFGLATTCNSFILGGLKKKSPLFFNFFFQTRFTNLPNPFLGPATPFPLPLPAFWVGPAL